MTPPLHVALVGFGFAGETFHAPLIQSVAGLRLVTVVSSRPDRVKARWPEVWVSETLEEVVANPRIDLVVLATPNHAHYAQARLALEAGKHVVVDKPFTVRLEQARALAALAAQTGRLLSVFQNRRWDADFLTLRRLVQGGALGEVARLESSFSRFRPQVRDRWREQAGPGSGLWYDLGPHLADQALQLFGPPQAVFADLALQREGAQTPDYFQVLLRYPRLRVLLHAGMLTPGGSPRFAAHGGGGSYVKHGLDKQEEALRAGLRPGAPGWGHDPDEGLLYPPDGPPRPIPNEPGDYAHYYAAVRDAILQKGPNPVRPEEAVAVMALLEAANRSAAERREVVMEAVEVGA